MIIWCCSIEFTKQQRILAQTLEWFHKEGLKTKVAAFGPALVQECRKLWILGPKLLSHLSGQWLVAAIDSIGLERINLWERGIEFE